MWIQKKEREDGTVKKRGITDFKAFPHVNSQIGEPPAITYETLDSTLESLRQHDLLCKADVAHAFNNFSLHPSNFYKFGVSPAPGIFYIFVTLVFGFTWSPFAFGRIATALWFILTTAAAIENLHLYVDDFWWHTSGPDKQARAVNSMSEFVSWCARLGIPLNPEKIVGPTKLLEILGIYICTATMTVYLSKKKVAKLKNLLRKWKSKRSATEKELQVLVGHLMTLARISHGSRTYTQRILAELKRFSPTSGPLVLSEAFGKDILWHLEAIESPRWKRVHQIVQNCDVPFHFKASTDACKIGIGAFFDGHRYQRHLTEDEKALSVNYWETLALVECCEHFGSMWTGKRILIRSDNTQTVTAVTTGRSSNEQIMTLLRKLDHLKVWFQFDLTCTHISGEDNFLADSLSRFQEERFLALVSQMSAALP